MPGASVLAIARDRSVLSLLKFSLAPAGLEVIAAREPADAVARAVASQARLVFVSLDLNGLALPLVRRLRAECPRSPVLVLSEPGQESEIALALEAGAAGYLETPLDEGEAAARAVEATTWSAPGLERYVTSGPVELDVEKRAVVRPALRAPLTPCEFEILRWLLTPAGRAYTRRQLVAADRAAYPPAAGERTVDAHVAGLRRKLGEAGAWIETLRGIGYRFSEPKKSASI